jgi:hypothetical protein
MCDASCSLQLPSSLQRVAQVSLSTGYNQAVAIVGLQASYSGLNKSTVRGWYIKASVTELKPDTLAQRARAAEGSSGGGGGQLRTPRRVFFWLSQRRCWVLSKRSCCTCGGPA